MPLALVLAAVDVVLIAVAALVGYYLRPRPGTGPGWLGVLGLAGLTVWLGATRDHAYLILLAYFPLGYVAMRLATRFRDRSSVQ